jgi:Domain of unknown function (DUF4112)
MDREVHETESKMASLRRRETSYRRLRHIARLLDSSIVIPVLGWRIGADAIIGLVPGIGDAAMGLVGAYLIYEAHRLGAPKSALARMIGNLVLDTAIGAIPIVGDIWDFFFRSNDRNMQILARHVGGLPLDLPYETVR